MPDRTTNLGLHQWAADDYVKREDFNEDNAKIDAAMERAYAFPIAEFTTTAAQSRLELDVSGVDWSAWRLVCADFSFRTSGTGRVFVRANTPDAYGSGHYADIFSTQETELGLAELSGFSVNVDARLTLYPFRRGANTLSSFCERAATFPCWGRLVTLPFEDLTRLYIVPETAGVTILSGASVKIWGQK